MKKKIVYIISHIDKAVAFEYIALYLKDEYELFFILLNKGTSQLENFLIEHHIPCYRVKLNGKKSYIFSLFKIYSLLKTIKPDIVHAHLFDASLIGLFAAKIAGIKRRIHTRHNATIHHVYFPHMVKYDKLINKLSTEIVSISGVTNEILHNMENVPHNKITLIHHGFELDVFANPIDKNVEMLKKKYNTIGRNPVVGVISRYIHWKGIQYIIPAFKKILSEYPDALLLLANAQGPYKQEIHQQLNDIPAKNFIEVGFEEDIFSLYHLFDIFVHTPIDNLSEAFGQTYIEALASGIPSVFTLSGIANDIIKDRTNALVVPYQDSNAIFIAVCELLKNPQLCEQLISNGRQTISEMFTLEKMITSLSQMYGK